MHDISTGKTLPKSISKILFKSFISLFSFKEPEQHYAICLTDNQLIGDLSCFYNKHDPCFTLGYTISYQFQRQGYAFEMLSKVLCVIEKQYPGMDIVGLVEKENIPSISLLKKLGFIEEGYSYKINSYIFVKKTIPFQENT